MISLPKRIFQQGERLPVTIQLSEITFPISKATLSLIGEEKVGFTMQSIIGKKGFQPILGLFFPTRHLKEATNFLVQSYPIELINNTLSTDTIYFELPINAIPSYYGDNGKITYQITLELLLHNGKHIAKTEEIIIDSDYKITEKIEEIKINSGKLIIHYKNPLLIGTQNQIEISTENLITINPLRFNLKGTEVVKASRVVMENQLDDLPLGQIQFDVDLDKIPLQFMIPSSYQHSYEGLNSRLEYYLEIHYVYTKKRMKLTRHFSKMLSKFPVFLENPKKSNQK